MSELSTPEWTALIFKALKQNSRRFAKAAALKRTAKRAKGAVHQNGRAVKSRKR